MLLLIVSGYIVDTVMIVRIGVVVRMVCIRQMLC